MVNNKTLSKSSKDELLGEFTSRYWMLMIFIFILYGAMGWKIWQNFDGLGKFFDSLKFSNSVINQYLTGHIEIIISFGVVYFSALAFWKFKKGIFTDSEYKIKFWSGILFHRLFSMVILFPFIIYLMDSVIPNGRFHLLGLILFYILYIPLPILFSVGNKQRKKVTDKNYIFWSIIIIVLILIYLCYEVKGFWEPVLILSVSGIIFPSSDYLLRTYTLAINNYSSIEKVHQLSSEYIESKKDGTIGNKIKNFFSDTENSEENPVSLPFAFESLEILGNMAIAGAFGIIALAWFYDSNIITAIYIHITLVICALYLWIVSNKFPALVDIKANGEWYKGVFLLERSDNKILIMNKEGKILFKPDIVSEIRIPFKVKHMEEAVKNNQ